MFFKNKIAEINQVKNKYEILNEWLKSKEYKRLSHLKTLIEKTYETVNINVINPAMEIDEWFTKDYYIEDFSIFFTPAVFNKLKKWCKEYEMLLIKQQEIIDKL